MITDLTPYQEHLDKMDLTEAQKLDLMNALWVICQGVIEQHFDISKPTENRAASKLKQE